MKLFPLALVFCFNASFGQTDLSLIPKNVTKANYKVHVKVLNWTIQISADFRVLDSSETSERIGPQKQIYSSQNVQINVTQTTTLFTAMKGNYNFISADYIRSNPKNKDSLLNAYDLENKNFTTLISKQLKKSPDTTVESIVFISGYKFRKTRDVYIINQKQKIDIFYMSCYIHNGLLTITVMYDNQEYGNENMNSIAYSKLEQITEREATEYFSNADNL